VTGASGESTTGLDPAVAAALAYLAGPLSGGLLLLAERTSVYVRFHAWQAIIGLGAVWAAGFICWVLAFGMLLVSAGAFRALLWLAYGIWAGWIVLWVICLVKAFSGQMWKMPVAGDYAERRASSVG
jgi:uncharacterized membrane protein